MFLSQEIDIKLRQIYMKICIYKILFKNSRLKTDHTLHIHNQSENDDIPNEP